MSINPFVDAPKGHIPVRSGNGNEPRTGHALNAVPQQYGPIVKGPPVWLAKIMDVDQGSQGTSSTWASGLRRLGTENSVGTRWGCLEAILIPRPWTSLKHERLDLRAWEPGSQAKAGVGRGTI